MHPELFEIPLIGWPIKSYGFMLMIGFLTAVWMAVRRAQKVGVDPDVVINLGFFALIGGVVGARLMYVIHYWDRDFAPRYKNFVMALLDITNITQGGMEFLGGLAGAMLLLTIYMVVKRVPMRLYFDIMAPGLMWGLAFGRVGCFLNGCCWGGICEGSAAEKWGVEFPFGSPAYVRQYQNRNVEVPGPLLAGPQGPLSRMYIDQTAAARTKYRRSLDEARAELEHIKKTSRDKALVSAAEKKVASAKKFADAEARQYRQFEDNLAKYPSLEYPGEKMTPAELSDLAAHYHTRKVHPVQLYGSINAVLAALFLAMVFRIRKRHGMVMAIGLMTYPWTRIILELIRVDNPQDSFGLTISQFLSLLMIASGVLMFIALRYLPAQAATTERFRFVPEDAPSS